MKRLLKEFKDFAVRGNVVDMAVGIIIGSAFGKIVTSLVNDIIMPPFGLILGKMDFSKLSITLKKATESSPAVTLRYGAFINIVVEFLIISFAIFLMVKQVNRLFKKEAEAETPPSKECPYCLSRIPAKASRCPYCTSMLDTAGKKLH